MVHTTNNILVKTPPLDKVCLGCKRTSDTFKQTPFGDYLCEVCFEADAKSNPDIYGDPLARKEIWQSVVETTKKSIEPFKEISAAQAIKLGDAECELCGRRPSERNRNVAWIKLHGVKGLVCRYCFAKSQCAKQGSYYLDPHGRCFWVTDRLKAMFVFGVRRLPPLFIAEGASRVLWEVQREKMTELITGYSEMAIAVVDSFCNRFKHADYDRCYDIGINTLFVCTTLHNADLGEFAIYLAETIKRELKRDLRKQTQLSDSRFMVPIDSVAYEIESGLEDYMKQQRRITIEEDLIEFQATCRKKVGEENWYLFTSWLYLGRTQAELGRSIGVIPQTISSRLARIREACVEVANSRPQWKYLGRYTAES